MNDDSRFTEGVMVSAEVANRAINDALQFASPAPGAALSPAYDELRRLAEAATPGPWETRYETDDECSFIGYSIHAADGKAISDEGTAPNSKDALFIAAANPATILSLLDALASRPAAHVSAPTELSNAFITLESHGGEGRNIVLKFNQRADAYAVHDYLLKGGGKDYAQPAPVSAHVSEREAGKVIDGILWPAGYSTDPNGVIVAPAGRDEDFTFGYNMGYGDGLVAIKDSVRAIEQRAIAKHSQPAAPVAVAPSPADIVPAAPPAQGALPDALPELPKPDTHCYDEDTRTDVWSHSAEQMHAYAKQYAVAIQAQADDAKRGGAA